MVHAAFGDGVPEDVKKKRMTVAWMALGGDIIMAVVVLLFLVEPLGGTAYYLVLLFVASGAALFLIMPRLPYQAPESAGQQHDSGDT